MHTVVLQYVEVVLEKYGFHSGRMRSVMDPSPAGGVIGAGAGCQPIASSVSQPDVKPAAERIQEPQCCQRTVDGGKDQRNVYLT